MTQTNTDKTVSTERRKDIADALEDMAETLGLAKGHRSILQSASEALRAASITPPAPERISPEVSEATRLLNANKHLVLTSEIVESVTGTLQTIEAAYAAAHAEVVRLSAPERSKEEVGVKPLEWLVDRQLLVEAARDESLTDGTVRCLVLAKKGDVTPEVEAWASFAALSKPGEQFECPINQPGCTKDCGSYGCGN